MPDITQTPIPARIKLLLAADSGAGKTGVLATLANAGFNVRILDIDGNLRIINSYVKPDMPGSIKYISLPVMADDLNLKRSKTITTIKNILVNGWKTPEENLGKIETWGPNEVLVIDTLTFLGLAALRGACLANDVKIEDDKQISQPIWGLAQKAVMAVVSHLCSPEIKCNVIFNTHLRYMEDSNGISKPYPNVLGVALSPTIGQYFTDVWRIDVKADGRRVFRTQADSRMFLKCSAPLQLKAEEEFDLGALFKRMLP